MTKPNEALPLAAGYGYHFTYSHESGGTQNPGLFRDKLNPFSRILMTFST